MSVKLFNKKTGQTANCERENWTTCRDHANTKGWIIYTPGAELTAARIKYLALIDEVIDENIESTVSVEEYNKVDDVNGFSNDDPRQYSEDYNTRAGFLRDKITHNIREMGIGSNFNVVSPEAVGDNNEVWSGTCANCGNQVLNYGSKGWEHTVTKNGKPVNITYCPVPEHS